MDPVLKQLELLTGEPLQFNKEELVPWVVEPDLIKNVFDPDKLKWEDEEDLTTSDMLFEPVPKIPIAKGFEWFPFGLSGFRQSVVGQCLIQALVEVLHSGLLEECDLPHTQQYTLPHTLPNPLPNPLPYTQEHVTKCHKTESSNMTKAEPEKDHTTEPNKDHTAESERAQPEFSSRDEQLKVKELALREIYNVFDSVMIEEFPKLVRRFGSAPHRKLRLKAKIRTYKMIDGNMLVYCSNTKLMQMPSPRCRQFIVKSPSLKFIGMDAQQVAEANFRQLNDSYESWLNQRRPKRYRYLEEDKPPSTKSWARKLMTKSEMLNLIGN